MLDARAGVTAAVGLRCLFIGVQGQAHGRVANGVRENLKTAAVQLRHRLLILVSLPKHLSAYAAVVSVGRQHRRRVRSEEHTSELQSLRHLVCRLLLEKKKKKIRETDSEY